MKILLMNGLVGMLAILAAATDSSAVHAEPGGAAGGVQDLPETAEESGHFKTFIKVIEAAGLSETPGGKVVEITHHFLAGGHIGFPMDIAHVQNSDHHATNGVLHVLDRVILPAPIPESADREGSPVCPICRRPARSMVFRVERTLDGMV